MPGSITREERRARIQRDDGALDDTVYRERKGGRGDICYHDDPKCDDLRTDDPAELSREHCHQCVYPACSNCVLEEAQRGRHGEERPALRHRADDVDYEFEWDRKHGGGEA